MRTLLNTLYVTLPGAYLARDGETVLIRHNKETRLRVPVRALDGIVCMGRASCSPAVMGLCSEAGLAISFLSPNGRFIARVEGRQSGNVLLRREQYRQADDPEASARVAAAVVSAKVANSRNVLLRAARDRPDAAAAADLRRNAAILKNLLNGLAETATLDEIRGVEGRAAHFYFEVFNAMVTEAGDAFHFPGRNRRPPRDPVNAMLSFVYTLMAHDAASALTAVGLDPAVGFLHRDRPGRPSLALDLMEEFRAFLGDRLVLSLVNLRQVRANGFRKAETGAVLMSDTTRKTVLTAYQKRKQEELRHPFLNESAPVGLLLLIQSRLLARALRGDLDAYPPFLWK